MKSFCKKYNQIYFKGNTSNFCELKEGRYGVWKGSDTSLCVSEALSVIAVKVSVPLIVIMDRLC